MNPFGDDGFDLTKMDMTAIINGAESESKYEYCDNTCELPGTLKKVNITTKLATGEESTVTMEVLLAKQHHRLPQKMFDIE